MRLCPGEKSEVLLKPLRYESVYLLYIIVGCLLAFVTNESIVSNRTRESRLLALFPCKIEW